MKWDVPAPAAYVGTPLWKDGVLYTGGADGSVYAIDSETGGVLWSKPGFDMIETAMVIAGDILVAGGFNGRVLALSRLDGHELWSFQATAFVVTPLLVVKDLVYVATFDQIHALELGTGRPVWAADTGNSPAPVGAPAFSDNTIYVSAGSTLLALDSATGREEWRVPSVAQLWGLAVSEGSIYVGSSDGHLYAFDQKTGLERWRFRSRWNGPEDIWAAPAVADDRVYAGSRDGFVYALDAETGQRIWEFQTAGDAVSDPVLSGGMAYVTDGNHFLPYGTRRLHALDAETGVEAWRFETASTMLLTPALGKGSIYVPVEGRLIALERTSGAARSANRSGMTLRTFRVSQNPGAGAKVLQFEMGEASVVRLSIYDVAGRLVARPVDGVLESGSHSVAWSGVAGTGVRVGAGIYFARLETPKDARTLKLIELAK